MRNLEAPIPSTPEFRDYLIDIYRRTGGETGHIVNHAPVILLTTHDRTGKAHTVPVYYGRANDAFVVIASKGGHPEHPHWYHNMLDTGHVMVEVLSEKVACVPRQATGEERDRLWRVMTGIWPAYDSYQENTSRRIPLLVLDPIAG